jgi:hypothetical protein
MIRSVALVRTDVSEGRIASFIRVTRIRELETTLAVEVMYLRSVLLLIVTAKIVPISPNFVNLMMEALIPPKRQFLQEPHAVTTKKTEFLI